MFITELIIILYKDSVLIE